MNGKTLCTVIGIIGFVGTVVSEIAGVISMNMKVKETVGKELDRRGLNKDDDDVIEADFKEVEEES